MEKRFKKLAALGLAGALAATTILTGCGSSGSGSSSGEDMTSFTWLVDKQIQAGFYDNWSENAAFNYFQSMEWDADGDGEPASLSFELISPVAGAEKDNVNTLVATGEYPDIMSMSYVSTPISELYEDGLILDLTEYVNKYMPNYKAWMEANPSLKKQMVNTIDGEEKILQIYGVQDVQSPNFGGYLYRRDWIVKYGTNPETGEAFTGGYEGDDWYDDVVFPSGNTDPIYISDWEWMFEIFETAMDDLGIDDGYCFQIYYPGYVQLGDFSTGFGGINPLWYTDDDNNVQFGATSDEFRAYVECMNAWYEKGWVDQQFDERSSDIFFNIDSASVYSGKVGAWYAGNGQFGNGLASGDDSDTAALSGICVWGAPQPINDVYGSDSAKGIEPASYYAKSQIGAGTVLTNKCENKDIADLLTAIDYLYSYEGGLLYSYGLSDELQAEINDDFYNEQGLENGGYTMEDQGDGLKPTVNTLYDTVEYLGYMCQLPVGVGLYIYDANYGYTNIKSHGYDMWTLYQDTATIPSTVSGQMDADQSATYNQINTSINTEMAQYIGDFITGRTNVNDDSAWKTYTDAINSYEPEKVTEIYSSLMN